MSQRGLEALLRPKSIAVIGASMKPQRAGYLMMRNLLAGGFNWPGDAGHPPPGRRFLGYWHGLPSRVCRLPRIWRCSVLTPGVILELLEALGAKRLQDLHHPLFAAGTVPGAARMRRALSDASARPQQSRTAGPMARAERQLFTGADPSR